jgi:hypothetical protein
MMRNGTRAFIAPQLVPFNRRRPFNRFEARLLRAYRLGLLGSNFYGSTGGYSGMYLGGGSYGAGSPVFYTIPSGTGYASPYGDEPTFTPPFSEAERLANRRRAFDEYLYERKDSPTPAGSDPR